jgi:hypothetical protein
LYRHGVTTTPGPELDAARILVVERGLTNTAVSALTELVRNLPPDALAPVKQSLKRFFSAEPWTTADDDAFADIVGPGSGSEQLALDPDLTLAWGWPQGRFLLRVTSGASSRSSPVQSPVPTADGDLGLTFESDVYPEVTPSPRTIRFTTPALHSGASRFYSSIDEAADDPRAARVFADFDAVTNLLVGPDFVAITIARPDQWDGLLAPILRMVGEEFTGASSDRPETPAPSEPASDTDSTDGTGESGDGDEVRHPRRLERAWSELGSLRADRPDDRERIVAMIRDTEPARRQVAAALLADAPPAVAARAWEDLYGDLSRSVRRSTIDAVVDADRESLRPLLERALGDADAWIRWKAVHGIARLGVAASRAAIDACAEDPDFRVRLEATRARRVPS